MLLSLAFLSSIWAQQANEASELAERAREVAEETALETVASAEAIQAASQAAPQAQTQYVSPWTPTGGTAKTLALVGIGVVAAVGIAHYLRK